MPIFTNNITQQNAASSGGTRSYPVITGPNQYSTFIDEFNREALNTSNAYVLYTNAAATSGTSTIDSGAQLRVLTAATLNDYTDCRTSGLGISRALFATIPLDLRTQVDFYCSFSMGQTTNIAGYVGLDFTQGAITALPTTAVHAGISWNTGSSNNFFLDVANGTTQVQTDSTRPIDTNWYVLHLRWSADQTILIELWNQTMTTLYKSYTTASFAPNSNYSLQMHWFVKALTTSAVFIQCSEWGYTSI